jgi:hypothetical protein
MVRRRGIPEMELSGTTAVRKPVARLPIRAGTMQLRRIAYHEAGHAVIARDEGIGLREVTIVRGVGYSGRVLHDRMLKGVRLDFDASSAKSRHRAEKLVRICLAGPLAQRKFHWRSYRPWHAETDHKQAVDILLYLAEPEEELPVYFKLLEIQTRQRLENELTWRTVRAVAAALLEHGTLTGAGVSSVIAGVIEAKLQRRRPGRVAA